MFKIVEVIGSSPKGYSEAITNAVDRVCAGSQGASWFEVVELRGAIEKGRIKEFQAKLKIAVAL